MRGVVEAPVMPVQLPGKQGARLVGIAAHCDHRFHWLTEKIVHMLRMMAGDIDADLRHRLNGEGMDISGGLGASADHIQESTSCRSQNALRKVAAAGVTSAKDEDSRFGVIGFHNDDYFRLILRQIACHLTPWQPNSIRDAAPGVFANRRERLDV